MTVLSTSLLVVGAGPAGSAAAAWAAPAGREVLLVDAMDFPRDKTCGDGLTPRAIQQMQLLGMSDWLAKRPQNLGIRMLGFGAEHELAWNGPHLPSFGSAAPRAELDEAIRLVAVASGATFPRRMSRRWRRSEFRWSSLGGAVPNREWRDRDPLRPSDRC